jgi:hypothetical protein
MGRRTRIPKPPCTSSTGPWITVVPSRMAGSRSAFLSGSARRSRSTAASLPSKGATRRMIESGASCTDRIVSPASMSALAKVGKSAAIRVGLSRVISTNAARVSTAAVSRAMTSLMFPARASASAVISERMPDRWASRAKVSVTLATARITTKTTTAMYLGFTWHSRFDVVYRSDECQVCVVIPFRRGNPG